jgi:NADH-quinone oxidoreductase subunit J
VTVAFWILAVLLVASAMFVITAEKPVHSVAGLLAHFCFLAITYFMLSAEFLAAIQLIVYSGAILMLFVFVIALLSSGVAPFTLGPDRLPKMAAPATLIIAIMLGFVGYGISRAPAVVPVIHGVAAGPVGAAGVFGSVADFGYALFTANLLPFEITAFILMVAVIGVILLAGDFAPYVPTRRRARIVERDMREAIVRGGEE